MIASRQQILAERRVLDIVIEPFTRELVQTGSVDVRLGKNLWRRKKLDVVIDPTQPPPDGMWTLERIDDDAGAVLQPNERVLGHTIEFVGARARFVPVMHGRSSFARWGNSAHQAGFGDVGYFNRWTLEIINHDVDSMRLHWGLVIAQIAFEEIRVDEHEKEETYVENGGHYQNTTDLQKTMREWTPEMMLPKPMKVIR